MKAQIGDEWDGTKTGVRMRTRKARRRTSSQGKNRKEETLDWSGQELWQELLGFVRTLGWGLWSGVRIQF